MAEHYAGHDTGSEMSGGEWVDPPMVTTLLRLPKPLVDALKAEAGQQHIRPGAPRHPSPASGDAGGAC
ncbi:hypothetical protein [Streptomyces sp. SID13031]|uniref:hypothetical protein n=1 Tax=Streptomyces sp. SID13031 TaxID=2706046 RepID=UPI0013CAFEC3|nr:hypothetical protein [Streptomyces sp. SID13031]NEA31581.1 hypothetical protein [Streptomyces sp. SID13031]